MTASPARAKMPPMAEAQQPQAVKLICGTLAGSETLLTQAAEALVRAHRELRARRYGLLIHDGYRPWYVEDILRCAEKNVVLRDAWASCYFHPFYEFSALEEIVEGIQSLGFTFVPLSEDMQ